VSDRSKIVIALLAVVIAAVALFPKYSPVHRLPSHPEIPSNTTAFLSAEWGMTPAEVAAANHTVLEPVNTYRRFYTPHQDTDKARYKALEQNGLTFLEREASAIYTFFDGKLIGYHLFLVDRDPVALDRDLRVYLASRHGVETSAVSDETPLKLIWDHPDLIVNYWFYKDTVSVSQKYTAGFGVVNRKLKQSLGA
jgi:hypothetical protein